MEKIENLLNTLKWQLIARLPKGSITNRVVNGAKSSLSPIDPFYYVYWLDIHRSSLKKYVLGTFKTTNEDYIPFINWLDDNFLKDNYYEIIVNDEVIKIPRPNQEDYKCFKAEFLDIIMPSITGQEDNIPYLEGPYEYGNVTVSPGDTILDIGANFGLFSSLALSKSCTVYAFEPTKEAVDNYLNHLKELDNHLTIIERAVTSYTGISYFQNNPHNSSCNSLIATSNNKNVRVVKTTTIDDFVSRNNIPSIDFIKADIEGSERHMLEGAKYTIREMAPKLSICYYHCLNDLRVLTKLLKEYNPHYDITVKYKKIYARDNRQK